MGPLYKTSLYDYFKKRVLYARDSRTNEGSVTPPPSEEPSEKPEEEVKPKEGRGWDAVGDWDN